jgi:hypothetical protein
MDEDGRLTKLGAVAEQEIIERGFSPAYDRLVEHHDDFVGMIAYAVFKRMKKDYVADCGYARNHKSVHDYYKTLGAEQARILRADAEKRLDAYVSTLMEPMVDQVYKAALNDQILQSLKSRTGFFKNVLASVTASLLFSVALLAVLAWIWQSNILPAFVQIYWESPIPAAGPQPEH